MPDETGLLTVGSHLPGQLKEPSPLLCWARKIECLICSAPPDSPSG
jgi:hypothetical protein